MSEWQPARIVQVHWPSSDDERSRKIRSAIIRVRPVDVSYVSDESLKERREVGCDSEQFFLVHREDALAVGGDGFNRICCEHEVLTD